MKTNAAIQSNESYIDKWLQSVADDTFTMSQRKVSSLKSKGIDLDDLIKKAKAYQLHLLLLKDDTGQELVAASKDEFRVLC